MQAQIARGPSLKEKDGITLSPDEREYALAGTRLATMVWRTKGGLGGRTIGLRSRTNCFDAREMEYTVGSEQSRDDILVRR